MLLSALAAAAAASACAAPALVRQIESSHPGATYDARSQGCDVHVRTAVRRFDHDLKAAVLWSRQAVGTTRFGGCVAVVEAVTDGGREVVYRIGRDGAGVLREETIPRP